MRQLRSIFGMLLLLTSITVSADMFTPGHSCSKPYRPYEFENESALEDFRDEVERYRRCIDRFVEEQNDAAKKHASAAEEAIEDWNRYVRLELN